MHGIMDLWQRLLVLGLIFIPPSVLAAQPAPDIAVIFSPAQSEPVKFAASEFVKYARPLTGADVVLVDNRDLDTQTSTVVVITTVGAADTNLSVPAITRRILDEVPASDEGFLIHTATVSERKYLFLIGRSSRAVVYAVYHYLERHCRVGFFKDYVEYIPSGAGLVLEGIHEPAEPAFPYRGLGTPHPDFRGGGERATLFDLDWRYKKKINLTSSPNPKLLEQRGDKAVLSSGPVPFSVGMGYPLKAVELFPKGLHSDGFSNWRGDQWYATNLIVDEYDDMLSVTRQVFAGILKAGVPEESGHMYYFNTVAEAGELNYVAEPMMNATWELLLEYDPAASMYLESYGSDKVPFLKQPFRMVMWDNQTDDAFLPNRLRTGSTFNSKCGLFGKNWVFCPCLAGGDDWVFTPGMTATVRIIRDMVARPNRNNCIAMAIYADAMSHWLYEDLYAQLTWDPQDITLERWIDDLAERRFGRESGPRMANSLATVIHALDSMRLIGYNNYVFDFWGVYKTDDACWFKTVRRDWWGYIHGQRNYLNLQKSLLLALEEANAQSGNLGYDHYILDVYKLFASVAFKFSLIQMHHHYYVATESFRRGEMAGIPEQITAFESNARLCDLVLSTLQDALSTVDIYRMQDRSSREPVSSERKEGLLKWQNARQAVFELVGAVYRPRFAVMVAAMRERLERGEPEIIDSKMIHPWYPSPDPYYVHAASKDPQIAKATIQVLENFIREPVILESFSGTTPESIRAGLKRLDEAGALYHEGMETLDAIAANFPLSDPPRKPAGYQPVKRALSSYIITPLYIGFQQPYFGSGAGHWFKVDENLNITCRYRGRSRRAVTANNTLHLAIMLDGLKATDVRMDPTWRDDSTDLEIIYRDGSLVVTHGDQVRKEPWPDGFRLCALVIESNYSGVGELPTIEMLDARVNGTPVPFYTDVWHQEPTVAEVRALNDDVSSLRKRMLH